MGDKGVHGQYGYVRACSKKKVRCMPAYMHTPAAVPSMRLHCLTKPNDGRRHGMQVDPGLPAPELLERQSDPGGGAGAVREHDRHPGSGGGESRSRRCRDFVVECIHDRCRPATVNYLFIEYAYTTRWDSMAMVSTRTASPRSGSSATSSSKSTTTYVPRQPPE